MRYSEITGEAYALGDTIAADFEAFVAGSNLPDDTRQMMMYEFDRARNAQIGTWAREAESLDGLTHEMRKAVEARRAESRPADRTEPLRAA